MGGSIFDYISNEFNYFSVISLQMLICEFEFFQLAGFNQFRSISHGSRNIESKYPFTSNIKVKPLIKY